MGEIGVWEVCVELSKELRTPTPKSSPDLNHNTAQNATEREKYVPVCVCVWGDGEWVSSVRNRTSREWGQMC